MEQDFYPIPYHPSENSSSEPNRCAVVTPEEKLLIKGVRELISWTSSDSELVERQRADSANRIIVFALEGHGVKLEDSHCTSGTNPFSKEEALFWEKPRSVRTME